MEYSIIGKMHDIAPEYNTEGELTNDPTYQSGFHVNARGEVPAEWEQYEIEAPTTPLRVYQGGVTRYFVFPDEDTFKKLSPQKEGMNNA
jgi:hypothetical protein